MAFTEYGGLPGNTILLADPELAVDGGPARAGLVLNQNYPNPFNPSTAIGFMRPTSASVTLSVHDASGRCLERRDLGVLAAGYHGQIWRGVDEAGRTLPSGVYFYRVAVADQVETRRMVLLR